jgi:hypothetical protein
VLAVLALPCRADQTIASSETLIRLTVEPAPAPKPALRYLLLPELRELNPGNPIQVYMKCILGRRRYLFDKEAIERRERLPVMPFRELPGKDLEDYDGYVLSEADRAARLDAPDWQILLKLKADGVSLLLPDLQEMRQLARALAARFRTEVALGRIDDALRTAKTMFAMARHLGEHPTLIADLVGLAVATLAIGPLEEILEQPDCPNLYWALTDLPSPLVPLNRGMDGERVIILAEFRDLDEKNPMTPDQIKRFIARMDMLLGDGKPVKPGESRVRAWLAARSPKEELVKAARRRLVEVGLAEERLLRFPADQVILLDERREYEVRRDEIIKLTNLPVWVREAQGSRTRPTQEPMLLAELIPGLDGVFRAQGRLDQRIALLRHVEALRLYAAEHNGAWPAKQSEIAVPLPDDPFSGRPFRYERSGATAHLRGTPPPGDAKNPFLNVHYELTVRPRN